MSKKFTADTRGLGGQKTVMDMMSGHYSALINVKSTMNTREKPFVHMSKQKRPQTGSKSQVPMTTKKQDEQWLQKMLTPEYDEQRETFRRCTNAQS